MCPARARTSEAIGKGKGHLYARPVLSEPVVVLPLVILGDQSDLGLIWRRTEEESSQVRVVPPLWAGKSVLHVRRGWGKRSNFSPLSPSLAGRGEDLSPLRPGARRGALGSSWDYCHVLSLRKV